MESALGGLDSRRFRGDGDGFGDDAVDVDARPGLHLDRRLAQHIRAPGLRGVGDEQGGAGGQAGKKGHDRDDDDQRAPGDGVAGDEPRMALERGLRFDGADGIGNRFVHGGDPSRIVSLPPPTTSLRAKPN